MSLEESELQVWLVQVLEQFWLFMQHACLDMTQMSCLEIARFL